MTSHPPMTRTLLAALLAVLALFAISATVASAADNVPPSTFEGGDGNLLKAAGTDWQDWTGSAGLVQKDDDDTVQSQFGTGSKEQDPGAWDLVTGTAPSKSDILDAAYASEVVSGDLFFYGAFERLDGSGNANVSFELNREPGTYDNGNDQVPIRTDGDLLITFDGNNSGGVRVGMCIWHGDREGESTDSAAGWYTLPDVTVPIDPEADKKLKGSGNCTLLSTVVDANAVGAMNQGDAVNEFAAAKIISGMSNPILDNRFGEASVNLSEALKDSGIPSPCLDFGSIWMHSRSSDAPLSSMKDFVGPENIQAKTDCSIALKKYVAVGTSPGPGDYEDANTPGSAVLANTGDQLNYLVEVTNPGANPITVDTDPPTDVECPLTEAGKVDSADANDATPAVLDPGDVWTYTCTKPYDSTLDDVYENHAYVVGHQGAAPATPCVAGSALPCVDADDPAFVQRAGRIEIVKDRDPGTSSDSFGFTASLDLAGHGLGTFSLSDDGVAGHDRTGIDLWPNHGNGGNGESYTVTEDPTGPGYRLVGLTCSDGDSIGDTGTRTATVNVDPGETVTCTYTNRFTAPGIAIDKTGPASATAGALLPYTLTVTNPGQESLAAATVVVTDQQCSTAPALQSKKRGSGADPTPSSLDPGDTWVYSCSGQTHVGQSSFANTACVKGADVFRRAVSACDTVTTALTPPPKVPEQVVLGDRVEPGQARIAGATGCVARKFKVTVRGKQIQRVEFRVDGKRRATVSKPDAGGRFVFKVNPRKFKPGSHVLVARSVFTAASNTRAKTMKLRFARCVRRTAPAFTG